MCGGVGSKGFRLLGFEGCLAGVFPLFGFALVLKLFESLDVFVHFA